MFLKYVSVLLEITKLILNQVDFSADALLLLKWLYYHVLWAADRWQLCLFLLSVLSPSLLFIVLFAAALNSVICMLHPVSWLSVNTPFTGSCRKKPSNKNSQRSTASKDFKVFPLHEVPLPDSLPNIAISVRNKAFQNFKSVETITS